ncbi:hypothetical protein GCM10009836_15500 [Pseudonocardia ailaonensis]|uniref:SLC26A/SulP transporter domain-containing protein n=1 Tax=Pseudonocardia ailaonensis TaxID=367279 RepID=A0ABN2MW70_9PSEU
MPDSVPPHRRHTPASEHGPPRPTRVTAGRVEAVRPGVRGADAARPGAARPDLPRADTTWSDGVRPDGVRPDSAGLDAARLEAARLNAAHTAAESADITTVDTASHIGAHRDTRSGAPRLSAAQVRADLGASLVVFLVAVPLSLGIALASGAPIMAGLVAGVVGGVVAGLLGGSPLQVSGPAAGLTVIVAGLVAQFGWQLTCLITVGAGLLQIAFGLTRIARFAQAIPPAVVHGMLAGIGITIALAQLHVVLGGAPQSSALANILELPARLAGLHTRAVAVGVTAIVIMVLWPRLPGPQKAVPGALVAVAAATALAVAWPDVPRVDLPGNLLESVALPVLPDSGLWPAVLGGMLTVALVASVESLLSAVAVDRLAGGRARTDADRELLGQGAGNAVSGLLGGLPITGVIVRSSANVRAGARTRASTVLHGCWIALFGIVLVAAIEVIPLAALSGLLVVVGLQLVKAVDMRTARAHGDLAPYAVTVLGVVFLNLLEGVAIGLVLAAALMLRRAARARVRTEEPTSGAPRRIVVEGTCSFLSVPALSRALSSVKPGEAVRVHLAVDYLDHTAHDHLESWSRRHRATGALVEMSEPTEHLAARGS